MFVSVDQNDNENVQVQVHVCASIVATFVLVD